MRIVTQVALCCLLVTCSFAALKGLIEAIHSPIGFRADGAAVVGYDLDEAGYTEERGRVFQQQAVEAVLQIPGVRIAAFGNSVPLSLDQSTSRIYREDTTDFRPRNGISEPYYKVAPNYFAALGVRLLAGREFNEHDDVHAPKVAIINNTLERKLFADRDWEGKHFLFSKDQPPVEVIGVVEDGTYESLTEDPRPALFLPILQDYSANAVIVARSNRPAAQLASRMEQSLNNLDPHLPIYGAGSATDFLRLVFLPMQAAAIALGAFGLLATVLAVTGIHGMSAYSVSCRAREIAIRRAVGAERTTLLRLIFGRTAVLLILGVLLGIVCSILASKIISAVVAGVSVHDPIVFTAALLTMVLIAVASICGPLRRALAVDPARILRED